MSSIAVAEHAVPMERMPYKRSILVRAFSSSASGV
jgi:hypothetical protein